MREEWYHSLAVRLRIRYNSHLFYRVVIRAECEPYFVVNPRGLCGTSIHDEIKEVYIKHSARLSAQDSLTSPADANLGCEWGLGVMKSYMTLGLGPSHGSVRRDSRIWTLVPSPCIDSCVLYTFNMVTLVRSWLESCSTKILWS